MHRQDLQVRPRRRGGPARLVLFAAIFASPAFAADEGYRAYPSEEGRRISFASCGGEEEVEESWGECIGYELSCDEQGIAFAITGTGEKDRDTRDLAETLIRKPWGEATAVAVFGKGRKADVPIASVTVALNEMNGDWDTTIRSFDANALLDPLTKAAAEDAHLDIGGRSFDLSPRSGDGSKLMAFKAACEAR